MDWTDQAVYRLYTEDRTHELQGRSVENIWNAGIEKKKKEEQNMRGIWDKAQWSIIHIAGTPQ
jgi:hypothetical protein